MSLAMGDISFVSFRDASSEKSGFAFVSFVPMRPNATIIFTDQEPASQIFNKAERGLIWTAPNEGLAPGALIQIINDCNPSASEGRIDKIGEPIVLEIKNGLYALSGMFGPSSSPVAAIITTPPTSNISGLIGADAVVDLGDLFHRDHRNSIGAYCISTAQFALTMEEPD